MKSKLTLILVMIAFLYIFKEGQALAITFKDPLSKGTMNNHEVKVTTDARLI